MPLNQGTTAERAEFGARPRTVLTDRAGLIRARLADLLPTFKIYKLALGPPATLPRDYEAGHAFGFPYQLDALPDEQVLRAHLQALVGAYLSLTYRGGLDSSSEQGTLDDDDPVSTVPRHVMIGCVDYRTRMLSSLFIPSPCYLP